MKRRIKEYYNEPQYQLLRKAIRDNVMNKGYLPKDGWRDLVLPLMGQTRETLELNIQRANEAGIDVAESLGNLLPQISSDTFVYRVDYDVYDNQICLKLVKLVGETFKAPVFDEVWEHYNNGFFDYSISLEVLLKIHIATR